MANTNFKHVSYLWDESKAKEMANDEVALFIYRSNLLGADLRLTNYGGGNTSVKITDTDPVTGESTNVMWIKGSGGDIGTLTKSGCAALYLDKLRNLEKVYRGIEHEDEMVALFQHCIFDLASKAPSIDTPLHDGAILVKGNKIISAGVILPLSRQGISRYGTRHLAALGITERFDRCICIVVSEETGTLSLANQGKLERPITSSRLQELLNDFIGGLNNQTISKSSTNRNVSMPKKETIDIISSIGVDKSVKNSD